MFSYYWYSPYGYNPLAPYRGTSNAYPYPINANNGATGVNCYNAYSYPINANNGATGVNCYNPSVPMHGTRTSDTCPTDEEILNYITNLEATRKIGDLSNVKLDRAPEPNDVLVYDYLTGFWVLENYISGGPF